MAEKGVTGSSPPMLGGAVGVTIDRGGKFLTFHLGEEEYGLEILKVQEIIGIMAITRVPRTPEFVRGVINLRGKVIPVVDLRLKFEMEGKEDTERTCIIVVQVAHNNTQVTMGLLVDEVSEVLDIDGKQIEPPPSFGTAIEADFIFGMGKIDQKVVMLLDVDEVLSTREIVSLEEVSESN
jgi:purine-binding chemotaxis protein CheW